MLTWVFGVAVLMVFFAYFGYPLSLNFLLLFYRSEIKKKPFFPSLTLIITAFNEEKRIREKLENTLLIDYPKDQLQILVASDGSTDGTNKTVEEYADRGVELLHVKERGGKENAQREAVSAARGDILAFSDVATLIKPHGLKEIAANFADPCIGCVSSVDHIVGKDGKSGGEGFYVRYEMWLRDLESRVNSLVGLSGSFFAARKEVCQDFSSEMQSDFRTLLNSMRLGLRGVIDHNAVGTYLDVADSQREFDRKIRTVLRGLTVFFRHLEFLNPFRYGFFSYQYFCHKLLRWLVPVFLLMALVTNFFLAFGSLFFLLVFISHFAFYGLAFWGWLRPDSSTKIYFKIPLYFLSVNMAILVAWIRYLRGNRMVMWTPSQR